MEHFMNLSMMEQFQKKMEEKEKSGATIEKYMRDVKSFYHFLNEKGTGDQGRTADRADEMDSSDRAGQVSKEIVIRYKEKLIRQYAASSVNSMLAALNSFFREMGWYDCIVKSLKVQRETFRSCEKELTKEEYFKLLKAAKRKGNQRLYLLMETICATGIRVSELRFITVESLSVKRAKVSLKGKIRSVILPADLCRELQQYIREKEIRSGSIFITKNGLPMDRSNILHEMKNICEEAGVPKEKVFPHNLRHLFACSYYQAEKDLSHLADLLGHSNINTTRIYTITSGEEQEKQIEMLGLVI